MQRWQTCGLVGMLWLRFLTPVSGYWTAFAAPLMLVEVGQGSSPAPLTTTDPPQELQ
ncbi:exported hypothetical protein [Agrobacterium sp. NCPPB 925]|nr:exported hypothetical protein [Agrobacterium sp. NCPPB 925]